MMNHAFLILTHKSIENIYFYASVNSDIMFYIHVDKKVDINKIKRNLEYKNVIFLNEDDRVDINWAGFSMIQATINLILYALSHNTKNEFFHLISADDLILSKKLSWNNSNIFIECRESKEHQYRMRFDTPHADTCYQRKISGKLLTQFYKFLDKILPTKEKIYFGSQWFSIRRNELKILINSITDEDISFFKKKLCPDEHFFQYLIKKNNMFNFISKNGNKRFIIFDQNYQHGSSPIFLKHDQILNAKENGYWFARKVETKMMYKFYSNVNED